MINKVCSILLLGIFLLTGDGQAYAAVAADGGEPIRNDNIVDIEVTEYEKIGMFEVEYRDNKCILPGDKISKIPRIHNLGMECYVRAKVVLRSESDSEMDWMKEITLVGIEDDWILAPDGYYYCVDVLKNGESADLFQEVWISENLPQTCMEEVFYLDIVAEAVQSTMVFPDYSKESPWGDVEIDDQERGEENPVPQPPEALEAVKTGEDGTYGRYAMLLGLSLWGAFLVICGHGKNRREEDG